jgi:predicted house-cleaning noncanonical NTP pyrophosphatase (MazG superfamily)
MPTLCRKLVRDRIPEIIKSEGHRPVTRVLDEASYRQALLAKFIEEAQEASRATPDGLPGELADVLESAPRPDRDRRHVLGTTPRPCRRQAQPTRQLRKKDLPRISGIRRPHD